MFFVLVIIIACSPLVKYSIIQGSEIFQIELIGSNSYYQTDSLQHYPVQIFIKNSNKNKLDSIAVFHHAILEYQKKKYLGELKSYDEYKIIEFYNLPNSFIPYETKHKHTIELTLIAKDSTKHLIKYESK